MIHEIPESNDATLQKYKFVIINCKDFRITKIVHLYINVVYNTIIIILGGKSWFNTPKLYSILYVCTPIAIIRYLLNTYL